jgi:hypothetical protein
VAPAIKQEEAFCSEAGLAAPQPEALAVAEPEAETPLKAEAKVPSLHLAEPPTAPADESEIAGSNTGTVTPPPQEAVSAPAARQSEGVAARASDPQLGSTENLSPLDAEDGVEEPKPPPLQIEAAPLAEPEMGASRSNSTPSDLPEMARFTALNKPALEEVRLLFAERGAEAYELPTSDPPIAEAWDVAAIEASATADEAVHPSELEGQPGDQADAAVGEGPASTTSQEPISAPRLPSPYRPNLRERTAARIPKSPALQPAAPASQTAPGSLDANLVLVLQPGGWGIELSLLLSRPTDLPEQISVNLAGELVELAAIDDGLFEPASIADPISALIQGVAAQSLGEAPRRWVRSGRPLHVFTERPGVFGFASAPRVVIGQENIILCEAALADQVLNLCQQAGSAPLQDVEGPGVPLGWRCLRGYHPRRPVPEVDEDIFLALSPLPDASIELAGGIAVSRSAWILGRPPDIRILGSEPGRGDVTIDLAPAMQEAGGHWTAPGWDMPGLHAVRFAGLVRHYEIVEVDDRWDWWAAHQGSGIALAGALASTGTGRPAIVVRDSGGWLLGAQAGEALRMLSASFSAGAFGSPSFVPVWALPGRTKRPAARLLDSPTPPRAPPAGARADAIRLWRQLIRDAAVGPASGGNLAAQLWLAYREAARLLKRRGR